MTLKPDLGGVKKSFGRAPLVCAVRIRKLLIAQYYAILAIRRLCFRFGVRSNISLLPSVSVTMIVEIPLILTTQFRVKEDNDSGLK